MNEISEIDIKKICCTCLSKDRVIIQLCRVKNGVNNLYSLLSLDSEAYRDVFFKDTVGLHICWECRAILFKFSKFSQQACDAQRRLTNLNDGRTDRFTCLSSLSVHHKTEYDSLICEKDNYYDNFVDCGPIDDIKSENDEDIPLSELHSNSIADNETDKPKIKCNKRVEKKPTVKTKKKSGCTLKDKKTSYGYLCKECNIYFHNKSLRWSHIQRFHKEGYKCATCGRKFAFKNNLARHEQNHSAPPPRTECQICHKQIRIDLYKVHARIHSPRQQYSCELCSKQFVSRASYEHHLRYTQAHATVDILKHKCSICDKGYRSGSELRDHINYQHMSKTKHKCPVCGKGLASPRCITRHVRRAHQGVKENARDKICQQCGKTFRDKRGLREHELIHTGERPLSCEICGCTFRQNASLYNHKKRVHKIYTPAKTLQLLE